MTFFDILWWGLMILYVPACIGLIVIVLLQKGKGTSFAGAFGVGAGSETVFGPRGSQTLPVRLTYAAAATFMTIALIMSIISGKVGKGAVPDLVEDADASSVTSDVLLERGMGGGAAAATADDAGDESEGGNTPLSAGDIDDQIRANVSITTVEETADEEAASPDEGGAPNAADEPS